MTRLPLQWPVVIRLDERAREVDPALNGATGVLVDVNDDHGVCLVKLDSGVEIQLYEWFVFGRPVVGGPATFSSGSDRYATVVTAISKSGHQVMTEDGLFTRRPLICNVARVEAGGLTEDGERAMMWLPLHQGICDFCWTELVAPSLCDECGQPSQNPEGICYECQCTGHAQGWFDMDGVGLLY